MKPLQPLDDFFELPPGVCPTCGSPTPAIRYVISKFGNGAEYECPDEWHDEPASDA